MRSSSTATACSCASKTEKPRCVRARALTGRAKFASYRGSRARPSRLHHRRRGGCARSQRRAGLRGAAGRALRRTLGGSDLFRVRSAVRGRRRSAEPAANGAQAAAQEAAKRQGGACCCTSSMSSTCPSRVTRCSSLPAISISKASSPSAPARLTNPVGLRAGTSRSAVAVRRSSSAAGAAAPRNLRSLLVGVYRGGHLVHTGRVGTGFNARNASDLLKKLKALETDKSPFGGKDAPRKASGLELGHAGARRRDRICGMDRRRQRAPGRFQGAARGQTGERDPRRKSRRRLKSRIARPVATGARQPRQGRQRTS